MSNKNWVVIIICGLVAIAILIWRLASLLYSEDHMTGDILMSVVLILSVLVALVAYLWSRHNDVLVLSEKKRDDFVNGKSFEHIRILTEHNDIELQAIIVILNIISDPYEYNLIPPKYQELHEKFDQYLNFLEGVAILSKHNNISKESLQSLWLYYFRRLKDVHIPMKDDQPMFDEVKKCIKKIYNDEIPPNVEDTWNKGFLKEGGFNLISDPVNKTKVIHPIEAPIWYYINNGDYAFKRIIKTVQRVCRETWRQRLFAKLKIEWDKIRHET